MLLSRIRPSTLQISLLGDIVDEDIAGIETELDDALEPETKPSKNGQAKRKPLPPELPRKEIHHDPDSTQCRCGCQMKRNGEDVSEKLDYVPGVCSVDVISAVRRYCCGRHSY